MDGLVITQDIAAPAKTTGNPSWAIAFKQTSDADIVKAKIKRVVWEASKHGKLVPVIEIEPVKLSGVTIKRATAFHAKFVSDNKLGPGAIVKLTRSGDVIPHVMSVLKPAAKPQMPPQSFGDWEWDTTDTNIYLTDTKQNDLVKAKRLTSFFTTLGVEYLSLGIITKFIDSGLDTVDKIINATPAKMVKLVPGVQDTLAKKLYTNIQDAITEADLATLMDASLLFGQNMGTKRCQLVLKKYPKILSNAKVDKATLIDKLMEVPGFSTTTATQFAVGLPKFVAWLAKHPRITYVIPVISVKKNGKMSGHTVVFTGIRSDEAEAWITKEGGVVGSSVSSSTTLLVAKDPNESSGKILKAKSLGVKIMKFDTFMKQVTK
jgi:NAD-dependent DNA ligase